MEVATRGRLELRGLGLAAGCQLVASCDLAVASPGARFCTPGVDIGLFCSTPAVALSRAVPRKQAMEMLLTGRMVGAEEALDMGLVTEVVPTGTEVERALALAEVLAGFPQETLRSDRRALLEGSGLPLEEGLALEARLGRAVLATGVEGAGRFAAGAGRGGDGVQP